MQLSIIGERRTVQMLDRLGHEARVANFGFFEFSDLFDDRRERIARVEELSDAHHLKSGDDRRNGAYLLEITRKR